MHNIKKVPATLMLIIILIIYLCLFLITCKFPPTRNINVENEKCCFDGIIKDDNLSCNKGSEIYSVMEDVDCFQAFMFTKMNITWRQLEHKHSTTKKCTFDWTYEKCPWKCNKCTFITMKKIRGRTGNQMFEVASLIGIARKRGLIPIIPSTLSINEWFNLPTLTELSKPIHQSDVKEQSFGKYLKDIEDIDENMNWTVTGYLQSFRYFDTSDDIIHELFKMKLEKRMRAEDLLRSISPNDEIVCMHVRRGDLLNQQYIELGPFKEAIDDFALLMSCKNVVITSGTFGWWGAYLSGGKVVYHNGFPAKGSWLDQRLKRDDYYLTTWTGLGDKD
ncbi:galactoside 2-alpha-L-fucosyltransferase Sec1-like isoform X2 [Mya arenaria]|uniref:galactoside 2-alpha-L-fucosyltransferase Sec1-like isoform X2 n=1 Tax=Mya arenaria TaxID=6604 RepID=UPI0022E549CF|nr:galactoside 2-alpha-L-fucosyltransferase Sec1-like isoform X2 [Mya arenaria]